MKNLTAIILALAAFGTPASFASNLQLNVSSLQCNALHASDNAVSVNYTRGNQLEVAQNKVTKAFTVTQLVPGINGEITLVGENSQDGFLQMNIDAGKTSMMLIGDQVTYLSCTVE